MLITVSFKTSLFNIENGVLSVLSTNSTLHHKVNLTLDEEIPVGKMIAMCQAADDDNLGDLTFGLDTVDDYFAVDKGGFKQLYFCHPPRQPAFWRAVGETLGMSDELFYRVSIQLIPLLTRVSS